MAPSNRVLLVSFGLNFLLALHLYSSRGASSTSALRSDHEDSRAELAYSGDLSERGNGGAGCTMCGVAPDLCDEVGADLLETAVAFGGTNDRLRRLLAKIQSGQPFSMGVVGGSVSQGTGFKWGDDNDHPREPWYRPTNLHRIIFEHLHALSPLSASDAIPFDIEATGPSGAASGVKAVFDVPGKKEGKNTLVNGAQGGTGSGYFAYCWGEHLEQDVDLFVIELAINDEPLLKNLESYELLVRSLLDQPHKPAVINVEVFALLFETIGFGGDLHKGINQFYNIPSISVRNPFLPQVMADFSQTEMFFQRNKGKKGDAEGLDLRHLSPYGHQKTGDLVNAYIDMQLCEMERHSPLQPGEMGIKHIEAKYPVMDIPKMRLNQQYHPNNIVPKLQPQCYSMKSTKHKLEPLKQEGWRTWSHGEKHYLISTQPGSTISFAFSSALGEVQLHYLRSKIFGLGNLWCWVDDDKDSGERIEAYWKQNFNIAQSTSFSGFKPGQHILHCENEVHTADPGGGHEFRIISLTSI